MTNDIRALTQPHKSPSTTIKFPCANNCGGDHRSTAFDSTLCSICQGTFPTAAPTTKPPTGKTRPTSAHYETAHRKGPVNINPAHTIQPDITYFLLTTLSHSTAPPRLSTKPSTTAPSDYSTATLTLPHQAISSIATGNNQSSCTTHQQQIRIATSYQTSSNSPTTNTTASTAKARTSELHSHRRELTTFA